METSFLAAESLLLFDGFFPFNVRSGITPDSWGNCNYYYRGGTDDYIKKLGKFFHATDIFIPYPENGLNIIQAQRSEKHKADGDAIVLRHKDFHGTRPLILFPTGDCPIVLLHNERISALVHCGWRGLQGKILTAVVADLKARNLLDQHKTKAIIWPGICQEHYPISDNVAKLFPNTVNDNHLDLAGTALEELISMDFLPKHIVIPDFCSFHSQKNEENLFSSHRRGDLTRNVVFMSINLSV